MTKGNEFQEQHFTLNDVRSLNLCYGPKNDVTDTKLEMSCFHTLSTLVFGDAQSSVGQTRDLFKELVLLYKPSKNRVTMVSHELICMRQVLEITRRPLESLMPT